MIDADLKSISKSLATIAATSKPLLSKADLSSYLGISENKIGSMNSEGRLPMPVHIDRRVFWMKIDIDRWIELSMPRREVFESIKQSQKGVA